MENPVLPSSCVTQAGTSIEVQNEWEENTHTTHETNGHKSVYTTTVVLYVVPIYITVCMYGLAFLKKIIDTAVGVVVLLSRSEREETTVVQVLIFLHPYGDWSIKFFIACRNI